MSLGRSITLGVALYACLSSTAVLGTTPEPPAFRIVKRGTTTLPQSVADHDGREVPVTGLSGITWLGGDRFAAVMDNSDKILLFNLPIGPDGQPGLPSDFEVIALAERHDYEDIALCPPPLQERIAARHARRGLPDPGRCLLVAEEDTPAIRAVSLADGTLLGVIPIPAVFATRRPNRGLEALDIDPDGRHIWTANEDALTQDGPSASADAGTVIRLTRIAIPEPEEKVKTEPIQIPYAVEAPHRFVRIFSGDPLSGVAAITGLGDGRLLVLERSGCPGLPPFENRIYLVDTRGSSDVTNIERDLAGVREARVTKTLLWKDQLGCNLEGMCLGPKLSGSERAVIALADNNGIGTPNLVVAFALNDEATNARLPLAVGGIAVAMAAAGFVLVRLVRAA